MTSSPAAAAASQHATDTADRFTQHERPAAEFAPEWDELDQLRAELAQRKEQLASLPKIEQAKGILMHNFGLSPDDAFYLLRRLSQDSNVKLHTVAEHVVSALTGHVSAQAAHRVAAVLEEFREGLGSQREQEAATCPSPAGSNRREVG